MTLPRFKRSVFVISLAIGALLLGCAVKREPIPPEDFQKRAVEERSHLFVGQEPVDGPIDLFEAMSRALKYNLEARLKLMEEALASNQMELARLEMLPKLAAAAGYNVRNNEDASVSRSLDTDQRTSENFTSREKDWETADVTVVWNVLDFGVSYFQAQQEGDRLLIAKEKNRKTQQNIIQEVRIAYWKAVAAEELLPEMDSLLEEAYAALDRSRRLEKGGLQSPMESLEFQQEILETIQHLWTLRRNLVLAKTELASLMHLKPGTPYVVQTSGRDRLFAMPLNLPIQILEEYALANRPELRQEDYQEAISRADINKAFLRMLPGLELNAGAHVDSTSYLYNQSWLDAGMRLSWNLFNMITGPKSVEAAKVQAEVGRMRRLAVGMAVMTQLHLARQRMGLSQRDLEITERLERIHRRKSKQAEAFEEAKTGSAMETIRLRSDEVMAKMERGLAEAESQAALGRVFHSLGIDPVPPGTTEAGVKDLAMALETHQRNNFGIRQWMAGRVRENSSQQVVPDDPQEMDWDQFWGLDRNRPKPELPKQVKKVAAQAAAAAMPHPARPVAPRLVKKQYGAPARSFGSYLDFTAPVVPPSPVVQGGVRIYQ